MIACLRTIKFISNFSVIFLVKLKAEHNNYAVEDERWFKVYEKLENCRVNVGNNSSLLLRSFSNKFLITRNYANDYEREQEKLRWRIVTRWNNQLRHAQKFQISRWKCFPRTGSPFLFKLRHSWRKRTWSSKFFKLKIYEMKIWSKRVETKKKTLCRQFSNWNSYYLNSYSQFICNNIYKAISDKNFGTFSTAIEEFCRKFIS